MIDNLVNKIYLDEAKLNELNKSFVNSLPYEHIAIENFFNENVIDNIFDALSYEEYYSEDSDLYSFSRTIDVKNMTNEVLLELKELLLSDEYIKIIEKITGLSLSQEEMDLHSLMFEDTNYLLCHDDEVQGRKIAFVIYLNDENFKGGEFELFDCDEKGRPVKVVKSIKPKLNNLLMFKVSEKSFHQVSEMIGEGQRISISGWYYEK